MTDRPSALDWVARDAAAISPSYTRSYPFVMDHGKGCQVWDVDGERYIDLAAGIAVTSTGHSHPKVVKAIQDQAERFLHMSGTDFYYPEQIALAERLRDAAPVDDGKVFFTNSGAESVEAAFKLSRWYTRRPRMLAYLGAFHGRTMGALSLTASKSIQRTGFAPLVPGVMHMPYPNMYRPPFGGTAEETADRCLDYLEKELFAHVLPPEEVAAVFVEPIQGEGGYLVPPDGYLPRLKEILEKYGILMVADEVQSGMGRTGKMFAIEHFGVRPDIICLAKGIASGMPLGAIVARGDVMSWPPGAHASTFGGNPVSCAAALATWDLLEGELIENAANLGAYFKDRLFEMADRHPAMGDVRGLGLMLGVEMVMDKATREPAAELRNALVMEAFEQKLLILGCGSNTLRFCPGLAITKDEVDEGLEIFERVQTKVEKEFGL